MKYWFYLILILGTISTAAQTQVDQSSEVSEKKEVYHEQLPVFPGGEEGMYEYLASETKYPKKARKEKIQGSVFVSFTVETDGSVTNVKVVRGVSPELDAEALRVVKAMPDFEQPAMQRGKPVPFIYNLPLSFSL